MTFDTTTLLERLLVDAGIGPGMRVLDVGCGWGEVSLLLSRLVGPDGAVTAIDREPSALEHARQRAPGVTFVRADLTADLPDLGPFDAAVGRRVLMYVPDPVAAVRRIASLVRPGGIVAFQEHDATMIPASREPWPEHDRALGLVWDMVRREGGDPHLGFALPAVLREAGLAVEHVRADAIVAGQPTHRPLADIVRAVLPRMVATGVVAEGEIDPDALTARLDAERAAARTVYVTDMAFGVWARTPA